MMAGFPYLNLLQRTDPGTVSAAAAVSASSSKVLMAGRHFLFFSFTCNPRTNVSRSLKDLSVGTSLFLITALVPKWREGEAGIYE